MEELYGGYTLEIADGEFPLSTDSMVLAHFVRLPRQGSVLDLGSGCGTLGFLLCGKDSTCHVTGIEISDHAHSTALNNIRSNGMQNRIRSIRADLRSLPAEITPGSFSCCISNPPYFSGGAPSTTTPTARQEYCCTPKDLFHAAAQCLKYGGDFFLVHKPEKLAQLIGCAGETGLEAKRLMLLRHQENRPINLIFMQFRKGGKPGLQWEEQCLFDAQGMPTPFYREVYHL